jgi:hypothetical protein
MVKLDFDAYGIDESHPANVDELLARNERLGHLFFFDARQMLLSVMCADWCGVVWPYLLDNDEMDVGVATANIETPRAEFSAVVVERRRRAATGKR